ncbi:hypothetical protein ORD22_05055 [Sporosarcina sp. GW1-11]|uniref:hypothetical protein n=1 Tax=Sporosarcina sp. GW1-11 TaxID=2899126 RepID=UPI00294D62A3|nr:hypothetical protein [Sporosarcina sp. GW1-11]MDV6377630.1 hypothetical protein [Sporosarcina sp. GW1-11]
MPKSILILIVPVSEGATAGSAKAMRQLAFFASWLMAGGNPPRAVAMVGTKRILNSGTYAKLCDDENGLEFIVTN